MCLEININNCLKAIQEAKNSIEEMKELRKDQNQTTTKKAFRFGYQMAMEEIYYILTGEKYEKN